VRRGELRRYVRPSTPDRTRLVVIVSADTINQSPRPWLFGVELRHNDPGDLLAIPVANYGWAYPRDLQRLYRSWVGDHVTDLDTLTLDRLTTALQLTLGL
jgi:hypothetical protein